MGPAPLASARGLSEHAWEVCYETGRKRSVSQRGSEKVTVTVIEQLLMRLPCHCRGKFTDPPSNQ